VAFRAFDDQRKEEVSGTVPRHVVV
jgi:hypothetical protein